MKYLQLYVEQNAHISIVNKIAQSIAIMAVRTPEGKKNIKFTKQIQLII
jgi:hypothetical protein